MLLRLREYRRTDDLRRECEAMGMDPPPHDALSIRSESFAFVEDWDSTPLPKALDPRPGRGRCLVHAPLATMREELSDAGLDALVSCIDRALDPVREVRSPLWSHRFDGPLVMGILNVTPDSFSDGGVHSRPEDALRRAVTMVDEGVDIIDIGGESTRPGASPVPADVEASRVMPIIEAVSDLGVPVSVDTMKPDVALAAVGAGARIVNDVSGLRDPRMADAIMDTGAAAVVMHTRGTPADMHSMTGYDDIMGDVMTHLHRRVEGSGIPWGRVMLDPGLGFAKTSEQSLEVVSRIGEMGSMGRPILVGASRKGFVGKSTGSDIEDRLEGSLAVAVMSAMGGADVLRVHDVRETARAIAMFRAVRG